MLIWELDSNQNSWEFDRLTNFHTQLTYRQCLDDVARFRGVFFQLHLIQLGHDWSFLAVSEISGKIDIYGRRPVTKLSNDGRKTLQIESKDQAPMPSTSTTALIEHEL